MKTASQRSNDGPASWVFFGGVPWHTPWLNDQQLSHALAAADPVLYVEPPRSPLSGLRDRASGGSERVLRPRLRRGENGVHILTTIALPGVGRSWSQRLSAELVRAQVAWAARRVALPKPVVAVGMGPQARLLRGAAGDRSFIAFVSDWLEAGSVLLGTPRATLAKASRSLWLAADRLCVTSGLLQEELVARGFESSLVEHGFDDTLIDVFEHAEPPSEYRGAGSPIIAVAGRLNGRLDVGLLERFASRYRGGSLFLIGPLAPRDATPQLRAVLDRQNVTHVPTRSRTQLPAYLRHADLLLVPYIADEWSRYSSPMKVWEYLYAGAPLVGHGCPPLVDLGEPLAYHGSTHDEVLDAVERALSADDPGLVARRRELAAENTWQQRAAELRTLAADVAQA
jgi:teichuronic acid biosynthesis glycosyltransferase TuaH